MVVVQGREIEATHEWQPIGENDTVAAGMHIRMDLTTGERFVKLPDESDQTQQQNHVGSASTATTTKALSVTSNDGGGKSESETSEQTYDYDMMYRTFSNLPPDEQERMGGIPKLEGGSVANMSPEAQTVFEARMKELWERRQEEIRAFDKEFGADLPQLLKDRIEQLQLYLLDPTAHLVDMDLEEEMK